MTVTTLRKKAAVGGGVMFVEILALAVIMYVIYLAFFEK